MLPVRDYPFWDMCEAFSSGAPTPALVQADSCESHIMAPSPFTCSGTHQGLHLSTVTLGHAHFPLPASCRP